MSIPPSAVDAITDRVVAKSRAMALQRLRDLEAEGKRLKAEAADIKARLALYCGKVSQEILALRAGDETTGRIRALPESE